MVHYELTFSTAIKICEHFQKLFFCQTEGK